MAEVPGGVQEGREVYPPSEFGLAQRGIDRIEKIPQERITAEDISAWHRLRRERTRLFGEPEVVPALGAAKIALDAALGRVLDEGKGGALGVATCIQRNRASIHSEIRALVDPLLSSKPERHLGMGSWYVDRALDRMYATFAQRAGIDISNNSQLASALRPEEFEWKFPENWEERVGQRGPEPASVGVGNDGTHTEPGGVGVGGPAGPREPGSPPPRGPLGPDFGRYRSPEDFLVWRVDDGEVPDPTAGKAFTRRWARQHGLPDVIRAGYDIYTNRDVYPSRVLSDLMDLARDPSIEQRLRVTLDACREDSFPNAVVNCLLPLVELDWYMKGKRLTSVAGKASPDASGPRYHSAVMTWLEIDQETRRALAQLLRLQGYAVANESGINDQVPVVRNVTHEFSDFLNLTPIEIRRYLDAVQASVGTDSGPVKLAYTIFRFFGFPHDNGKFLELYQKYVKGPHNQRAELGSQGIGPFIDKLRISVVDERGRPVPDRRGRPTRKSLSDFLRDGGVSGAINNPGLTEALDALGTEEIGRRWERTLKKLDGMDKLYDARAGTGAFAGLSVADREKEIGKIQELLILQAQREFTDEEFRELMDLDKISGAKAAGEYQSFWQRTKHGFKVGWGGVGTKPPSVRGSGE